MYQTFCVHATFAKARGLSHQESHLALDPLKVLSIGGEQKRGLVLLHICVGQGLQGAAGARAANELGLLLG